MVVGFEGLLDFVGYRVGRPFFTENNNLDLFIHGKDSFSTNLNLFINGKESQSNNLNLFISGQDTKVQSIDLFINGNDSENNDIDLTIVGNESDNQSLNLSISGTSEQTIFNSIDLFISGFDTESNSLNLFIQGGNSLNQDIDLIILGKNIKRQNLDLSIKGNEQNTLIINLFLSGKEFVADSVYLFIKAFDINSNNIDLFIQGSVFVDDDLTLFVSGPILTNNNIDLFLKVLEAKSFDLFIEGRIQPPIISCPILDPGASVQISDDLIRIYQSRIDALINQLGKNILLEFDPIIEPCPNCEFNIIENRSNGIYKPGGPIPFSRGSKCPFCKGSGFLERSVNKCIKCLVQWNNRDTEFYKISVQHGGGIVRLKSYLKDYPDLVKCKTIITNHDTSNILKLRVRKIKGPVILGLRYERYVTTYWKLI